MTVSLGFFSDFTWVEKRTGCEKKRNGKGIVKRRIFHGFVNLHFLVIF
jgi:hypothetical protein